MAKSFSIMIKGSQWTISLMSEKTFLKKYPGYEDAGAICRDEDNSIVFMPEHVSVGVVRHEVLHALVFEHEDYKKIIEIQDAGKDAGLEAEELCAKISQKEYGLWMQLTEQIVDMLLKKKPAKAKEQLAAEEAEEKQ